MRLVRALHAVRAAFAPVRAASKTGPFPLDFWLNMLEQQVVEARAHLAAGLPDKARAEIADCFSVGWQALEDNGGEAEAFIVNRIRTRIIPRAKELHDRDAAGNRWKVRA